MNKNAKEILQALLLSSRSIMVICCFFVLVTLMLVTLFLNPELATPSVVSKEKKDSSEAVLADVLEPANDNGWRAPPENTIPSGELGDLVKYGRELIAHTSVYLGPKGSVAVLTNGMNCQNCHNDAGTKALGLNYSAVASTYPQFRPRANAMVSIEERINGCFQRSMNGDKLDPNTKEMKAIVAYMEWLGSEVPKGVRPDNAGVKNLAFLDVAADPVIGEAVYATHCLSCHGVNGEGILNSKGNEYIYPPLWGDDSYNDGAGLYRLRNFSAFVKYNMPFGASENNPILTDEEAWHVAAFVNSQPRPHKDQSMDWKDVTKKSIDVPIGPYPDSFSEKQHKYGPFGPIVEAREQTL